VTPEEQARFDALERRVEELERRLAFGPVPPPLKRPPRAAVARGRANPVAAEVKEGIDNYACISLSANAAQGDPRARGVGRKINWKAQAVWA